MRGLLAATLVFAAVGSAATVTNNIEYVKRSSGPLLLDVSIPEGPGPFPAVIVVHGGGFTHGNKRMFTTPIFEPLSYGRFAWFTIDYRLAPAVRAQEQVDDVLSALAWVHQHTAEYRVDRQRIALMGESAGAYLVDYAAAVAPKETPIAGVVSFYGPADLAIQFKDKPVPDGLKAFFSDGLQKMSPVNMVREGMPPFLLLHGTADELVPYEESPKFCEALKAHGNQCDLYTIPGARHGMSRWEEHADQQGYKFQVIGWLTRTLKYSL